MDILIKIVGCIFFSVTMVAIPILCALSFALEWHGALQAFLLIICILQVVALSSVIYDDIVED